MNLRRVGGRQIWDEYNPNTLFVVSKELTKYLFIKMAL